MEFGICREEGEIKAYGAGILSSFGELEYCRSDKPKILPFDPEVTALQEYPITTYQPVYFATESFEHAKKLVKEYAKVTYYWIVFYKSWSWNGSRVIRSESQKFLIF